MELTSSFFFIPLSSRLSRYSLSRSLVGDASVAMLFMSDSSLRLADAWLLLKRPSASSEVSSPLPLIMFHLALEWVKEWTAVQQVFVVLLTAFLNVTDYYYLLHQHMFLFFLVKAFLFRFKLSVNRAHASVTHSAVSVKAFKGCWCCCCTTRLGRAAAYFWAIFGGLGFLLGGQFPDLDGLCLYFVDKDVCVTARRNHFSHYTSQ